MVPSDLSNNSASSRHARSKLCNLRGRALLLLCSPHRDFARFGSALGSAPVGLTANRNLHLGMAFRSPDKTTCFQAPLPGSMLLTYPFGSPLSLLRTRSIHPLVHAAWLAPDGANSSRQTRCPVPSERPRPFFRSSLPLGAFGPLPIKALT